MVEERLNRSPRTRLSVSDTAAAVVPSYVFAMPVGVTVSTRVVIAPVPVATAGIS